MKNLGMGTVILGMAALLATTSCSNDNDPVAPETDNEQENLDLELTYDVGEASSDSVFTRASAPKAEVEHQTFMGMVVETSFREESPEPQAAATAQTSVAPQTRATVYNTVDLNGKTVYAFVFDPATGKTIASRQMLTVTDGKLTVRGRRGCKILFYIGGAPYANTGADISAVTVYQNGNTDPMQCISETIVTGGADLGTLSFRHVFSKLRVVLRTSDGTPVNAFSLTTKEQIGYGNATVNIFDRTYTGSGTASTRTFAVTGNTTSAAVADYQNVISNPSTPADLTLLFATEGKGATIDGVRNYLTSGVNNTLALKSRTFLPGHRYSINITVRPANSDEYLNSGFRADRQFY